MRGAADSPATAPGGATLTLDGISKRFGSVVALRPLTLEIPAGALVALLGPSGCGKTTTLRIIAGFETADTGEVIIGGRQVTDLPPNRRKLGMVFQNYSLFPHLTAGENVAFGLKMAGIEGAARRDKVAGALALVRLAGFDERYPHELSGGQQQRVALARSIVTNPQILLLDEPLGALDKNLRESMQFELRQLQRQLGITTVLVTHDQEEALTMSDLVAVMKDGAILQYGPPETVYQHPTSRFVAEFLGASNVFRGRLTRSADGRAVLAVAGDAPWTMAVAPAANVPAGDVLAVVRPEKVALSQAPSGAANEIAGEILGHVFRGAYHAFQIRLAGRDEPLVAYRQALADGAAASLAAGSRVFASWREDDVVLLAANTGDLQEKDQIGSAA